MEQPWSAGRQDIAWGFAEKQEDRAAAAGREQYSQWHTQSTR